jgi:two-component system, sensor histidine kinase
MPVRSALVMIVDGDAVGRAAYRSALAAAADVDYRVLEAGSGEAGLALCQAERPDCILLDCALPDLDPMEFLARLQRDPGRESIPVVMVTRRGFESAAAQALQMGVEACLGKGSNASQIRSAVRTAMERRRLLGEAGYRVLIVDDAPEDRETYRRQLQHEGRALVETLEAQSGEQGLLLCRMERPDCVLLDFSLPDMDGLEFLDQLRNERGEGMPALIMLTGQGNEAVAVQAMKRGAQDYLVKGSTDAAALRRAIANAREKVFLHRQLEQQRRQLREADRRKDEFLATLAHELRNPLAPLQNALSLMRLRPEDRAATEHARRIMERQVHHMVRLVDDLLEVGRITLGRLVLRRERVELRDVVRDAVDSVLPLITASSHELHISAPDHPVYLEADPTRITQVLANLLTNAAKYMEPGGRIDLTVEEEARTVRLRLRDTGLGIPEEALPHVFELFSRVERGEGDGGGLGIGLALVKRLVEMHEGSVEVRSAGPGQGSEFLVTLPCLPPVQAVQAPQAGPGVPVRGRRVLVADDNADAADTLAAILSIRGNEVRTAYNGMQALEQAGAWHPDLVILDIGMPVLDGHATARRLREQPWGKGVVLVALTGWGQEKDKAQAAASGFDFHFTKPIGLQQVEMLLAGAVERQPSARASLI